MSKGELVYSDPEKVRDYLRGFADGQEMEIVIKKKYKVRTSKQPGEETNFNGYYWGVIVKMIADEKGEIGEEAYDEISDWIQINVGNFRVMPDGTKVAKSTKIENGPFSDMCMRARMWANIPGNVTEHGMYIPEPHEVVDF
jgi:hypothetical protein